jgi:hypothetical protein
MKKLLAIVVLGLLWSEGAFASQSIFPGVAVPVKYWGVTSTNYYDQDKKYLSDSSISYEDAKSQALSACREDKKNNAGKPEGCLVYEIIEFYKKSWRYFGGAKILPPKKIVVWSKEVAKFEQIKPKKIAKKPDDQSGEINLSCSGYKGYGDLKKNKYEGSVGDLKMKINAQNKSYEFWAKSKPTWVKMKILDWQNTTIKAKDPNHGGVELFDYSTYQIRMLGFDGKTKVNGYLQYNCNKEIKETIAKKPEPKKPIENKPEKQISRATNVDPSLITIGSGSGFYINNKGYALTNNHVIDICAQSVAVIDGKETLFRVIATDKTNDVAVLKTDYKSRNYIKINEDGAKLGENVIAVGYPLAGRLSDSVKITRGIVSSLSGLDNNIGQIQIDAALQPGNSGGPVLNENGDLIGIASAGLNKLLMAKEAKYIPENVNFAVASPIVVNILKSKKVKYTTPSMFSGSYSNTELAELGDSSTIQLFCRNTRTAYNKLKSSNKYSTVLLDLD